YAKPAKRRAVAHYALRLARQCRGPPELGRAEKGATRQSLSKRQMPARRRCVNRPEECSRITSTMRRASSSTAERQALPCQPSRPAWQEVVNIIFGHHRTIPQLT